MIAINWLISFIFRKDNNSVRKRGIQLIYYTLYKDIM